jgi:DNA-binding response OmpR family regulator
MSSSEQSDNERLTDRKFAQRTNLWVIIVDDEESIRLAVGDYLYDQGYQVTACADADALIEVCAQSLEPDQLPVVPDAIISDIRMPGKDGIELLKMIRADDRLKQVPVILLTAKGLTSDRILGFKAGADAYLPKPFNPDELLSILDNAILRRRQMQGDKKVITDIKQDLAGIKMIMKQNSQDVVKQTDVYLTPVEREVLNLLCKGYTNAEIAAERGISLNVTVQQIKRLYQITNTDTRTALVRWAFKTGYISKR